jgi:hypothetical protein
VRRSRRPGPRGGTLAPRAARALVAPQHGTAFACRACPCTLRKTLRMPPARAILPDGRISATSAPLMPDAPPTPPVDPMEALRAEAVDVFLRYVQKHLNGRMPNCPVCGPGAPGAPPFSQLNMTVNGPVINTQKQTQWTVVGLAAFVGVYKDANGNTGMNTSTTPVVLVLCSNCFYTMHFAWMPIKRMMGA